MICVSHSVWFCFLSASTFLIIIAYCFVNVFCLPIHMISGWSFRTNSTTGPVSSLCPSTFLCCPPFLSKMACFKHMDSDSARHVRKQTLELGRKLDAGTIHTVITTTNLRDSGLKLTLVATFFTMTILKMFSVVLIALLLYPANLWINGGSKFLFCWWLHFVSEIFPNTTCHTSWGNINMKFTLCCVNCFALFTIHLKWAFIQCNVKFK